MQLSQLIGYNMRNIFIEKSYTNCGGKAITGRYSLKLKFNISLDQWFKVSYSLFLLRPKLRAI